MAHVLSYNIPEKKRFLCHARSQAKANDRTKKKRNIYTPSKQIMESTHNMNIKKKCYEKERNGIKSTLWNTKSKILSMEIVYPCDC